MGSVTSTRTAQRRLTAAQKRIAGLGEADETTWQEAFDELHQAERELARQRGEQYAEVIDIGGLWDVGAPMPHVIAGSHSAFIVTFARDVDPDWDGTSVTVRSPSAEDAEPLLVIEIARCHDIRFGGPNDEAIHGHPLHGRGLVGFQANEVHNSEWLASAIQVNSVHPYHSDAPFRRLHHYVLPFHDETVEALGESISVTQVLGSMLDVLVELARRMTSLPRG
jgi:hypothetical protein